MIFQKCSAFFGIDSKNVRLFICQVCWFCHRNSSFDLSSKTKLSHIQRQCIRRLRRAILRSLCFDNVLIRVSGLFRWGRTCRTCRTNCGVVVVRRVIIIAAVNGITLVEMRLFRPKRNLRVHLLDAQKERFRDDFPKMFGFFRN